MRRPRKRAEDTKAEILATAERLFGERGVSGCSIAHIAQALSMSPANVFKHFHSKVALADEICERQIDRMMLRLEAFDSDAPAPERLRIVVRRLMESHLASLEDSPYMLEMIFLLSGTELKSGHRYKEMLEQLFLDLVRHGIDAGIYRADDLQKTSRAVSGAFASVLHPVFLANTPLPDLLQRSDELVDLVNAALQNPLAK
ncbi:TetR family transcriptional regulator [Rhizobium sp. SAFR-030]|uniref:TetR family transcriptional regulator n=1 Tax=Rhizobium sp. SAFR-030 TaxID=3387277 RepID=UPI003F7F26D9